MIEERALVLSVDDAKQTATVRTQRQSACDSCKVRSGCGQGTLSRLAGDKSIELSLPNSLDARPGDVVMIAIPEQGLLAASLIMFLLPLLSLLLFSVFASLGLGVDDSVALGFGIVGLLIGLGFARVYGKRHTDDPRFRPEMTAMALSANSEAACR